MLETAYGHEQTITRWRNWTYVSDSNVMARWLLRADMVQLTVKVFMAGGHGMMMYSCCGRKTLLSTCMEGGKSCKEVMTIHASGGVECRWAEGEKMRKDWALGARKEKGKKDLVMTWA